MVAKETFAVRLNTYSNTPNLGSRPPLQPVKVQDRLRKRVRCLQYSIGTEKAYVYCGRNCTRRHGVRHPETIGHAEVEAFLSWLANDTRISTSTHRHALFALLLLYKGLLDTELP